MAIFNLKKRLIECKIVYYGPGRCGKTTNLEYIFAQYKKQVKGEMVSINTEGDRTLFFDFLLFFVLGENIFQIGCLSASTRSVVYYFALN